MPGTAARLFKTWPLQQAREALKQGEKVLVVATTALGDSILTTPLIESLSTHLGRERVSLLIKAPYADLFQFDYPTSSRLHGAGKISLG